MLDKLKFNNLVISNKNGIQKSRIQTINKLVHKIRKLKALLEKHTDNSKCKERIRKATETMELLKKFRRVDVMKKVLLMDKSAAAVITNGKTTPEEVAVALLSMNKIMQGLIKRFKTELQINEDINDQWKRDLMELSKRRQKIERTEEKRRKRLELKQQKVMGRKRQEWLDENLRNKEGENISTDSDCNVSTTGCWQIEEIANDNIKEVESVIHTTNVSKMSKKKASASKTTCNLNKKQKIEGGKESIKNENIEEVKYEHVKELKTIYEKPIMSELPHNESSNDTTSETAETFAVDPFFITDTGENYMSSAIIKRESLVENHFNNEKRDLQMIKLNSSDKKTVDLREHSFQTRNRNQKHVTHKITQNNNSNAERVRHKWDNKRKNIPDKFPTHKSNDRKTLEIKPEYKHKKFASNGEDKNLHPSWAAKQKLKSTITAFAGQKIIFGDEHSSKDTKTIKSTVEKTHQSKTDNIHPSWAAKQKLKPTITVFQGKKITFNNDE